MNKSDIKTLVSIITSLKKINQIAAETHKPECEIETRKAPQLGSASASKSATYVPSAEQFFHLSSLKA